MQRGTIINSNKDIPATTDDLNQSRELNSQSSYSNTQIHNSIEEKQQIKASTYYETIKPTISIINNNEPNDTIRAKNDDYSQTAPTIIHKTMLMTSSIDVSTLNNSKTSPISRAFSSTIYIDEVNRIEKYELNTLNNRLENYLDKMKNLANRNISLRDQINNIYGEYKEHNEDEQQIDKNKMIKKYQYPLEIKFNNLCQQLNNEVQKQLLIEIRLQRADYDKKIYENKIKLVLIDHQKQNDQIQIIKQQLEVSLYELDQLKNQYNKQEQSLQLYKRQYNEYITKLIEYANDYNTIIYERMENENCVCTLKEQLSFERKYNHQYQQEFEYIKKIQYDINNQFNKNELQNFVEKIREDYQKFHEIQISELDILHKTKLDLIENKFKKDNNNNNNNQEETKDLIEQNQLLKQKLQQIQNNLQNILQQNQRQYNISNHEYKQLQIQLPELKSLIINLRDNTVHLYSQINTYRCLLINLASSSKHISSSINKINSYIEQTTGFIIHIENEIVWVRI